MDLSGSDWKLLSSLLPADWRRLAAETGALKGLRKDKSAAALLRTLLIHLAGGCSLRQTADCPADRKDPSPRRSPFPLGLRPAPALPQPLA